SAARFGAAPFRRAPGTRRSGAVWRGSRPMNSSTPDRRRIVGLLAFAAVLLCGTPSARAELRALEILHREPFAGGTAFGATGPYERITAVAPFALDPAHARNRGIVDLSLAPRNADGKVAFEADVCILAPRDPAKGNGALFYDVNNRGNK